MLGLMEGEWSCYGGGQFIKEGECCYRGGLFNGGGLVMLERWSV